MALMGHPGVTRSDIVQVQPVVYAEDPRGEDWGQTWTEKGRPIEVIQRKLPTAEAFNLGRRDRTLAYNLYAEIPRNYRPGVTTLPVKETERVWHPEGSRRKQDGTPDYSTAMEVTAVVPYPNEGLCQIDVVRTV